MKKNILSLLLAGAVTLGGAFAFAACNEHGDDPAPQPDERPFIVAFGDSAVEGAGTTMCKIEDAMNGDKLNEDGSYNLKRADCSYAKIAGEIMGYRVENYATGGYTTANVTSEIKTNLYGCADALREADYIYLGIIGNDLNVYRAQIAAEAEQNKYTTIDSLVQQLYLFDWPELMDTIRSVNPDAPLFVHNLITYQAPDYEGLDDSTGMDQVYWRLWDGVVLRYQREHEGAYTTVDLDGIDAYSFSNGDGGHPNDRYNMKLALSLVERFAEAGIYTRNDAEEAARLKEYLPNLWDGFNRCMANWYETGEIGEEVSVDIDAANAEIAGLATLDEVADYFCELYTQKDPRPFVV